jgi:molybdopterin/thiamine biosynthesis adenylyltransferase
VANAEFQDVPRPQHAVTPPPRVARFPELVGLTRDLHRILDELELLVIGAGSVGKRFVLHAAQLQPRSLTIVDPACYKQENLLNQWITPDAIGRNKAEYVGQICTQISPNTRVRVFAGRAEELPLDALCSTGFVMLATDNLGVEVDVGQRALNNGVPLVQASVAGEFLVAQIRFCGNADDDSPCLACGFGPAEWGHVHQETVFSCQGGEYDEARQQPANRAATRSTSSLCSTAADLAMTQMIRHLGGIGVPVVDTLLEWCGYTHATKITALKKNIHCPCEHRRWNRYQTQRALSTYTPLELANIALGHVRSEDGVSLTIDRLQFCEVGVCTHCAARQPVEKFVARLLGAGTCPVCGGAVDGLPFHTHRPVPLAVLGKSADRPLRELLERMPNSVIVRGPNTAVLCVNPAT